VTKKENPNLKNVKSLYFFNQNYFFFPSLSLEKSTTLQDKINAMGITHIEGSNGSSRISWNQLYLHTEVTKQVRTFGLETSTFAKKNKKKFEENVG